MRLERLGPHLQVELLVDQKRTALDDPVGRVDEPECREREARVGHQRQLKREREDVRIGGRQLIAQGKPAHPVVSREPVAFDLDALEREHQIGELARGVAAAQERELRRSRDHRRASAREQRQHSR